MKSKHEEIAEHIQALIEQNIYKPHSKLPSENSLAIKYGCSRLTSRKALQAVKDKDLIFSKPGKGYFVSTCPVNLDSRLKPENRNQEFLIQLTKNELHQEGYQVFKSMGFEVAKVLNHFNFCFYKTFFDHAKQPVAITHTFINTDILQQVSPICVQNGLKDCWDENGNQVAKKEHKILIQKPPILISKELNIDANTFVVVEYQIVFATINKILEFNITYTLTNHYVGDFKTNYGK